MQVEAVHELLNSIIVPNEEVYVDGQNHQVLSMAVPILEEHEDDDSDCDSEQEIKMNIMEVLPVEVHDTYDVSYTYTCRTKSSLDVTCV